MLNVIFYRHSLRNRGGDFMIIQHANYLADQGHRVTICARHIDTHFTVSPHVYHQQIPYPGVLGTVFFITAHHFKKAIVIVDLVLLAVAGSLLNKNHLVYYAQDDDETYYKSVWKKWVTRWCYRRYFQQERCPAIFVSDCLARCLLPDQRESSMVVPNGLDGNFWKTADSIKNINSIKRIIVYARSDPRKGFDIAINTLKLLADKYQKKWEVCFVGPAHVDDINEFSFKHYGEVTQEVLRDVLQQGDIFLSTSRHEGFGLLPLQAMACGCAMVTTDAFKLVTHEVNGLVAPHEDEAQLAAHLNRVLSDESLLKRIQKNGMDLAKRYDIKASCKVFESTILNIIKKVDA